MCDFDLQDAGPLRELALLTAGTCAQWALIALLAKFADVGTVPVYGLLLLLLLPTALWAAYLWARLLIFSTQTCFRYLLEKAPRLKTGNE